MPKQFRIERAGAGARIPEFRPQCAEVIDKALEKDLNARYQTAGEMKEALESAFQQM